MGDDIRPAQCEDKPDALDRATLGAGFKIALEYLVEGSSDYIEGKLIMRGWQGSDGRDRYATEICITELKMTGGKRKEGASHRPDQRKRRARAEEEFT